MKRARSRSNGEAPAGKPPSPAGDSPWSLHLGRGLVLALTAVFCLRQVASVDVGFHLRTGAHILSGQGWPRLDPFTFTVTDHPYIDTSWGYQVMITLVQRALGAPGLVLFHTLLVLAAFFLITRTARLGAAQPHTLLLLLLAGTLASEMRFEVRPELLSWLFLATVLHLLHRRAEGLSAPLWLLPPLFLIWANCHSLFILGWLAMACCVAGQWLRHRQLDRTLALWFMGSVGVTLLNPYGWKGMVFPFTLGTRLQSGNVFAQSIGEFTSPFALNLPAQFPFYPRLPIFAFRVLFVLVVVSMIPLLRQRRFWSVLTSACFLYLSFQMVRNMPLLVVGCLPSTSWALPLRWHSVRLRRAVLVAVALICVLLGLRVANDGYYIASRRVQRFGLGWNHLALPVDAAAHVHNALPPGRVLNHLNFGGYLMWALQRPVFIDGRLEVMGEAFFQQYRHILASTAAMEAAVARYQIGWLIFPYTINPKLLDRISKDDHWTLAYLDTRAVLFVRRNKASSSLVDPATRRILNTVPQQIDLGRLPGLDSRPRTGNLSRWLDSLWQRQTFPSESFNLGLFHYFRGDPARAAPLFAQAIQASGGRYYEIYQNLGSALYRLGRYVQARDCYRVVLEEHPGDTLAARRLRKIRQRSLR